MLLSRLGITRFEGIQAIPRPDLRLPLPRRWRDVFDSVKREYELIPGEIVEWMRESAADHRLFWAAADRYSDGGGVLEIISGDPWTPGMTIENYRSGPGETGNLINVRRLDRVVATVEKYRKRWDDLKQLLIMYVKLWTKQNRVLFNFFRRFSRLPFSGDLPIPSVIADDGTPLGLNMPFSFQLIRPALRTVFSFSAQVPEETTIQVNLWDSGRNTITKSSEVVLPEGGHDVVATFRATPTSGYVELDPVRAPSGLTIANVRSTPLSI